MAIDQAALNQLNALVNDLSAKKAALDLAIEANTQATDAVMAAQAALTTATAAQVSAQNDEAASLAALQQFIANLSI